MWPSENPWPVLLICVIGAVVSGIRWASRRQWGPIAAAVAFLVLGIAAVAYDRAVVTPREQIRENINEMTRAFQLRDLPRTLSYISDSAWDVQLLAAEGYNLVQVHDDMRVTDIQVELLAQGQRARSRFRVNATLTYVKTGSSRISTMWEAKWQQETGGWKMIEIIALDPISGEPQSFLESHRDRVRRLYPR